jgi:hypothetical protein
MTKGNHQLSLRLTTQAPATLTAEEERELLHALAELLLAAARAPEDDPKKGGASDDQDWR